MARKNGFIVPQPFSAVGLLLVINVAIYAATVRGDFTVAVSGATAFAKGAIHLHAFAPGERWRLLAATFLHANPAHLLMNMVSLLMIGPALERCVGFSNFVFVYLVAALAGSVASVALHHDPFLGVGASGALFGILGGLLALWVLGDAQIPPSFFLINFGLNFAFAAGSRHIDFFAHIGGFAGGLAACAALDLVSRLNNRWLRCKFPEYLRAWLLGLAVVGGALAVRESFAGVGLTTVAAAVAALGVKGIDVALSLRRGLAGVVAGLVAATALLAYGLAASLSKDAPATCGRWLEDRRDVADICTRMLTSPWLVGLAFALLAAAAGAEPFLRGLSDKGFVAASFVAERRRGAKF